MPQQVPQKQFKSSRKCFKVRIRESTICLAYQKRKKRGLKGGLITMCYYLCETVGIMKSFNMGGNKTR